VHLAHSLNSCISIPLRVTEEGRRDNPKSIGADRVAVLALVVHRYPPSSPPDCGRIFSAVLLPRDPEGTGSAALLAASRARHHSPATGIRATGSAGRLEGHRSTSSPLAARQRSRSSSACTAWKPSRRTHRTCGGESARSCRHAQPTLHDDEQSPWRPVPIGA
jgi:hypothetical protein